MHRESLLQNLRNHTSVSLEEKDMIKRFQHFVETTPTCFERTHTQGHITASSFVLSKDRKKVLLAHHAKLLKWLQLGGHADGCPSAYDVAHREAAEESGLSCIMPLFIPSIPIDFDIHEIPANKKDAAHLHYDVRYVFHTHEDAFTCSNESLELKWVSLDDIDAYSQEPSILRVIDKIKLFIDSQPST